VASRVEEVIEEILVRLGLLKPRAPAPQAPKPKEVEEKEEEARRSIQESPREPTPTPPQPPPAQPPPPPPPPPREPQPPPPTWEPPPHYPEEPIPEKVEEWRREYEEYARREWEVTEYYLKKHGGFAVIFDREPPPDRLALFQQMLVNINVNTRGLCVYGGGYRWYDYVNAWVYTVLATFSPSCSIQEECKRRIRGAIESAFSGLYREVLEYRGECI
jgi:hypothetical protein